MEDKRGHRRGRLSIRYNECAHICGVSAEACVFPVLRRRDGRVAEGARLESVYTLTGIVGSNPTLSASSTSDFSLTPLSNQELAFQLPTFAIRLKRFANPAE
jgi:hypothetical protein